jgi:hypothetical protein
MNRANYAKITCRCGYSWATDINGTPESVRQYFLGKEFNIGDDESERIVKPIRVDYYDNAWKVLHSSMAFAVDVYPPDVSYEEIRMHEAKGYFYCAVNREADPLQIANGVSTDKTLEDLPQVVQNYIMNYMRGEFLKPWVKRGTKKGKIVTFQLT